MEKYDYESAVREDVLDYIREHYDQAELSELLEDPDKFYEILHDECWMADSVTGNASGSYTFSTWQAEENLCHNWDLMQDAFSEFGMVDYDLSRGAEYFDVSIRCYLLGQAINEAIDELMGN